MASKRLEGNSISYNEVRPGFIVFCSQGVYLALNKEQRDDMLKTLQHIKAEESNEDHLHVSGQS